MINIEVQNNSVERISNLLDNIPGGAYRAMGNAIGRGLTTVRSETIKQIREVYDIKQKDLINATHIKTQKPTGGDASDIIGYISFSGYKIPLDKFKVSSTKKGIKASQKKGGTMTSFANAFMANLSGNKFVAERVGSSRFPIKGLYGSSTAQMAGNAVVYDEVEKAAQETIDKRVEHEITRLLNGYGR
ncbi:MAG: phage tail protein [Oscillospiraceae bacterium]|nr:phage tail protein [Oscillospiraceae bacterium]